MDPTIGALIGVVIGGALTGGAPILLRRRDERLERRAAARLVSAQVADALSMLKLGRDLHDYKSFETRLRALDWDDQRPRLARLLDNEDWAALEEAIHAKQVVVGAIVGDLNEEDLRRYAEQAISTLTRTHDLLVSRAGRPRNL